MRKSADEDNPWAIIIRIAPIFPIELKVIILAKTKPICATDE